MYIQELFTFNCLHFVWNVVVTQIAYAFQLIEKKVMNSAVGKLSLEQQFCKSDAETCCFVYF